MNARQTRYLTALLVTLAGLAGGIRSGHAEAPPVELAPYMTELQQLTHKLSLSVAAKNPALAEFYLYESLQVINTIQEQVPEYRGIAVAVLLDQIARPHYDGLTQALAQPDTARWQPSVNALIDSCNQCHQATQHGLIKIRLNPNNPYLQDFRP
ncbi:hypothetical protein NCG89_12400 [Spongiibacter taiwanensis]|uniref:hypothetical protein n=1 Tax=Spongiibacter taiwanensis TaxID=1748242 RepID=UPI00203611E9|nr:hypothetical protein [Spongiibacter taiwanensis]USA42324.1 hypothetical protein NCG89_12400 [Spongiibacter taiwanensis]